MANSRKTQSLAEGIEAPLERDDTDAIPNQGSQQRRGRGRPFQPGESGNRKGRPKKLEPEIDHRAIIMQELVRPVSMPGERSKVPAIQAVVRGTIVSAVKGNSRSQHETLALYRQLNREAEVMRDVIGMMAQARGVDPKEVHRRLRARGLEVPGNFDVIQTIVKELEVERRFAYLKMLREERASHSDVSSNDDEAPPGEDP